MRQLLELLSPVKMSWWSRNIYCMETIQSSTLAMSRKTPGVSWAPPSHPRVQVNIPTNVHLPDWDWQTRGAPSSVWQTSCSGPCPPHISDWSSEKRSARAEFLAERKSVINCWQISWPSRDTITLCWVGLKERLSLSTLQPESQQLEPGRTQFRSSFLIVSEPWTLNTTLTCFVFKGMWKLLGTGRKTRSIDVGISSCKIIII